MFAYRAIYNNGWVAATTPPFTPWNLTSEVPDVDDYQWELYHVAEDFSQAVNLADKEPARLRALQDLFWVEAARYNVVPLDNSRAERMDVGTRPSLTRGRSVFTYFPGAVRIPEGGAPDIKNKSFRIAADVVIPPDGASGIIATQGGCFNGWAFYLKEGKPVFHYNLAGVQRFEVVATEPLSEGEHVVAADFKYDGGLGKGGTLKIMVDGKEAAQGRIERTIAIRVSTDETFDVGEDTGTAVNDDYQVPYVFNGELKRVLVQLSDSELTDADRQQIERAKAALHSSQ
jgi:arylsulfatase